MAWLAASTVIFGVVAWLRRVPAVRGAGIAVCVVGVFGLIGHQIGGIDAAALDSIVLTSSLVFALDASWRRNALASLALSAVLPFAAIIAYGVAFVFEMYAAGVACAAFAGAVLAAGVESALDRTLKGVGRA